MSDLSIQPANIQQKKKLSPVKKGALIGASMPVVTATLETVANFASKKDTFETLSAAVGSKNVIVACFALGVAIVSGIGAGIGAGIGKIVEICKNKKAQKTQAEG